jgi:putative ABC transport system permease protein
MSEGLVTASVRQRPVRTLVSVVGVALGVVLIVLIVGLAHGMLKEQGRRNSNIGAEILFSRPGAYGPGASSPLSLPVQYGPRLAIISGVKAISPVGQYLKPSNQSFGMELVEGIDYASYLAVTDIHISEGREISADDEIIVDPVYAKNKRVKVGDQIDLFNRKFRIAGIYQPAIGSRIKLRLSVMQKLLGSVDRCSFIYVKCQNPQDQEQVAKNILAALPGNKILFTRDIQSLYEQGIPALNVFLKVVIGVALVISTLVIMLAMYTTIIERTREIGILKSLGAPKRFIVSAIEKEALLISALGVLLGFAVAFAGKVLIMSYTTLLIEIEPRCFMPPLSGF